MSYSPWHREHCKQNQTKYGYKCTECGGEGFIIFQQLLSGKWNYEQRINQCFLPRFLFPWIPTAANNSFIITIFPHTMSSFTTIFRIQPFDSRLFLFYLFLPYIGLF